MSCRPYSEAKQLNDLGKSFSFVLSLPKTIKTYYRAC